MARFFETFEVVESEGDWTKAAYPIDTLAHGFVATVTDICVPADRPDLPDTGMGTLVYPFAIEGNMIVPTRCTPEQISALAVQLMANSTEMHVTKAMWEGAADINPANALYLKHVDVTEVPRVADYAETLAEVLETAYAQAPYIKPVVHLGWQSALALQFGLQNLKLPYVVPPGYPKNAIAVTDSVRVRLSPIRASESVDWTINRRHVEVTRFAAIEFDPNLAVRAADSV